MLVHQHSKSPDKSPKFSSDSSPTLADMMLKKKGKSLNSIQFQNTPLKTTILDQFDGWGTSLFRHYNRKMNVFNRGFGGYTSYWLNFMIPSLLDGIPSRPPALVTLLIGTNDASTRGNQHVPLNHYKKYLSEIIAKIKEKAPHSKILVLTPPPVSAKDVMGGHFLFKVLLEYRNACIDAFHAIEGQENLELLDTWDLFIPGKKYDHPSFDPNTLDHYFSDKLHFSGEGGRVLFEGVVKVIERKWPYLDAKNVVAPVPLEFQNGPSEERGDDDAVKKWLGL
ncbi:UNVERIFIED_CONTAM: hypothetical protein HDU68_004063 [Siphonaria sp. JEL0065]|nr:hypothetical protein HDU68_004063 [Siphonaria sp. JEL0065]